MDDHRDLTPPEESLADAGLELLLVSANVATAGFAGFLIPKLFRLPSSRRAVTWMTNVADSIVELKNKKPIDIEQIINDPLFQSTVIQASHAAIRTHHHEKLAALRNAILHSALPDAPDAYRQHLYVRWIDELTPLHLRVLEWSRTSRLYPRVFADAIVREFPETSQLDFNGVIASDLISRKLVEPDVVSGTMYVQKEGPKLSTLGSNFLWYICDPLADAES